MNMNNEMSNPKGVTVLGAFAGGRVSTIPQAHNKYASGDVAPEDDLSASVKKQKDDCKAFIANYKGFCPKCGKSIVLVFAGEFFDEGKTGTNFDRDGIEIAKSLAKEGKIQLIVNLEADRLGRNQYESQVARRDFVNLGVQVCSIGQPKAIYCPACYDIYNDDSGVMIDSLSDLKSHLDLSRIKRNFKSGMLGRVRSGFPAGSLAYGLKKTKDINLPNGARIQEYDWDKDKAKVVRRIVHEYMDLGLGMWKISQGLNNEGVLSSEGKLWGRSAIKCLLNNPAYAGYARYQWKPVVLKMGEKNRVIQPREKWVLEKAVWWDKRLWDLDYYDEIQKTIKQKNSMGGRASASDALLVGLLKCGYCGYGMFQSKSKKIRSNGKLYEWRGYFCGTYAHRGTCVNNGKSQDVVDALVIKEVLKLANSAKSKEAYFNKIRNQQFTSSKEILKDKEHTFSELNKRLIRASEAYLAGVFDLEKYSAEKRELIPAVSSLELEIERLRKTVSNPKDYSTPDYSKVVEAIRSSYEQGNYKSLQILLRKIIEKIDFKRKPFNVRITFISRG